MIIVILYFSVLKMKVKIERFSLYASIPEKARLGFACFNLYSARIILLEPNKTKKSKRSLVLCFLQNTPVEFAVAHACL